MVDDLQATLMTLRPEIDLKEAETQILVVDLEKQQKVASEQEQLTAVEEAESKKLFDSVAEIKSDCEVQLAKALPIYK